MYTPNDHTFVLCAYKENPFLEETICSLESQTAKGQILVATSTPNTYIDAVCRKHGLDLYVNEAESSTAGDWNFGYNCARTDLVTIAHQDDRYEPDYLELVLDSINAANFHVDICFTDYYEIRGGAVELDNRLLAIKRLMNRPFSSLERRAPQAVKERVLALGDCICCPSVTFNKAALGDSVFDERYRNSCDYRTWVDLANADAGFLYVPAPLMGHRIYEESATTQFIEDDVRSREDLEIMSSLWPDPVAKALFKAYSKGQDSNALSESCEGSPGKSSLVSEVLSYSAPDILRMALSLAVTRVSYPGARLVRQPISVCGKHNFLYGRGFTTGRNCRIEVFGNGKIVLGENVRIGDNVHIAASEHVSIGDECLFASKVYISDTSHGSYGEAGSSPSEPPNYRPLSSNPVSIGKNVWLGENVVVLPGVSIGDGCIVGANATVSKSLPDSCIAVGTPARPIKRYDETTSSWVRCD